MTEIFKAIQQADAEIIAQALQDFADPYFGTREAAQLLRVSAVTLSRWRRRGYGPASSKLGGRLHYKLGDLRAFVACPSADAGRC